MIRASYTGVKPILVFNHIFRVGQNRIYTPYDRILLDFPAKNTVYTPYIYGSGQPYTYSETRF